jgi:hypothetical protein
MKQFLKFLYHRTFLGKIIMQKGIDLYQLYCDHMVSDIYYIKKRFEKRMGYKLDLKNPNTLNEKINWLKVYFRTPYHTTCADKYAVRDYVKARIGEQYLVPLIFVTKNPKDINPENLPDEPFIIKTNHDSGSVLPVINKAKVNWIEVQNDFSKRLKLNYYHRGKEWQYKDIKPCLIVEKLLNGKNGSLPFDYKLHCFNGKVNMIQVDINRFTDKHYRNWYNTNWEREPYKWSSKKGKDRYTDPSPEDVERPQNLEEMIKLSEIIAKDFIYVRVDWYDVEGKLYFGEITFHHDGGTSPIIPKEWDLKLGNKLKLPVNTVDPIIKLPVLQEMI